MDLHQALLGAALEVIADDKDRQWITADGAGEEQAEGLVFGPLDFCSAAVGGCRRCRWAGLWLLLPLSPGVCPLGKVGLDAMVQLGYHPQSFLEPPLARFRRLQVITRPAALWAGPPSAAGPTGRRRRHCGGPGTD